jgi:hypothetical protein
MQLGEVSRKEHKSVLSSKYASLFTQQAGQDIESIYADDTTSVWWTNNNKEAFIPSNVSRTPKGQNGAETLTIVYTVESPHHVLKSSTLAVTVPDLVLKQEYVKDYRFKMADNFGYFLSTKAELTFGNTFKCTLTPYDQVALFEHMTKSSIKTGKNKEMGKGNISTTWVKKLKSKTVFYPQQWGYSLLEEKALMLYMLAKPQSLMHKYEFDLCIKKHINVQRFNPSFGNYEDVPSNMDLFEGSLTEFAQPTLYGEFSDISPEEMLDREEKGLNTFYIHDMISCDPENASVRGANVVSFKKCKGLTQAVFFSLENTTNAHLNHNCNYTSDVVIDENSVSGIQSINITTNTVAKMSNISPNLFLNSRGLESNSDIPGMFVDLHVNKVGHGNQGGAMLQKTNTKFTFTIDASLREEYKFQLKVSSLVVKKFTIRDGNIITSEDY